MRLTSVVITSFKDLSRTTNDHLKQASTSQVWLANFDRLSTGAFACGKNKDGTVSSLYEYWTPSEDSFTARDQELEVWRDAILAISGRSNLDVLEIHSTAQWDIYDLALKFEHSLDCEIRVRNLVLSGFHLDTFWLSFFYVQDRVTLRGCKHFFDSRNWVFLPSLQDSPRSLHLVGGRDMDAWSLRWCLFNIACTQRNRYYSGAKPFKEIVMQFPISSDLAATTKAAWNDLPPEHRAGATLRIDTAPDDEYKGSDAEELRYQLMAMASSSSQDITCSGRTEPLRIAHAKGNDSVVAAPGAARSGDGERESRSAGRLLRRNRHRSFSENDVHRRRQECANSKADGVHGQDTNTTSSGPTRQNAKTTWPDPTDIVPAFSSDVGLSKSLRPSSSLRNIKDAGRRELTSSRPGAASPGLDCIPTCLYPTEVKPGAEYPCGCEYDVAELDEPLDHWHPEVWMRVLDYDDEEDEELERQTKAESRLTLKVFRVLNQHFGHSDYRMETFWEIIRDEEEAEEQARLAAQS